MTGATLRGAVCGCNEQYVTVANYT